MASAVFTVDAPSVGPEHHAPLLVLHGFPTSSFDYAAVLDGLREGRRVLLLDMVGYGLSSKPDRAYSIALQADVAAAFVAALGIERLALSLTTWATPSAASSWPGAPRGRGRSRSPSASSRTGASTSTRPT